MSPADRAWDDLRRSLRALPRRRSKKDDLTRAAVLVPLFWRDGGLHAVLTRRPDTLTAHGGQVAFPGGKLDPGETVDEAALREAHEELAIAPAGVELLGPLHDVEIVTGYLMTPVVGRIPPDLGLVPNPDEVARVFTAPLEALADPERSRFELRPFTRGRFTYQIPYFHWDDEVIWGATGRVVLDLLRLLYPERRLG